MADQCFTDFQSATKGVLTRREANRLRKEIQSRAEEAQKTEGLSPRDSLLRAQEEILRDNEERLSVLRRAVKLSIIKQKEVFAQADLFKLAKNAVFALTDGVEVGKEGARTGAAKLGHAYLLNLFSRLTDKLNQSEVFDYFQDGSIERMTVREGINPGSLEEELRGPNKELAEKAVKLAGVIRDHYEDMRIIAGDLGIHVPTLEDFFVRQSHNPTRMLHAASSLSERVSIRRQVLAEFKGFKKIFQGEAIRKRLKEIAQDRWKDFVKTRLDLTRTFGDLSNEEVDKELSGIYDNLVSGDHGSIIDGDDGEIQIKSPYKSGAGPKLTGRRTIHFKSGDEFYEYMKEYGSGSLRDQVETDTRKLGSQFGILEKFGPRPFENWRAVKQFLIQKHKSVDPKVRFRVARGDAVMNLLSGRTRGVPDEGFGAVLMGARLLANLNLGGIFPFVVGPDQGLAAQAYTKFGGNIFANDLKMAGSVLGQFAEKDRMRIAANLGVWADNTMGATFRHVTTVDSPRSFLSKAEMTVHRLSFMNAKDFAQRFGVVSEVARDLATQRGKSFAALEDETIREMQMHGLGEKEWDLLREAQNLQTAHDKKIYFFPSVADNLTKESIARYLDKDVSEVTSSDVRGIRRSMSLSLFNMYGDLAQSVIPSPSLSTRAMLSAGENVSPMMKPVYQMVTQFWHFPTEMTRRTLGHYIYSGGDETISSAILNGTANYKGLAQFIVNQTKWGYLSLALAALSRGLTPPSPFSTKTFFESMGTGGGLAAYWSLFEKLNFKYGNAFNLALPAGRVPGDIAKTIKAYITGNHPKFQAIKLLQNDTPFFKIWWTQWIMNKLIFNQLLEQARPGYIDHLTQRAEKDGQHFLTNP